MATMHDILRWTIRWLGSGVAPTGTMDGRPSCDVVLTDVKAHAIAPELHHAVLTDTRAHAEAEEC